MKTYIDELDGALRLNSEDTKANLHEFVKENMVDERDRQSTIEAKAHSLMGQTSITVSLLLASITLGATQLPSVPIYSKVIIWLMFLGTALQFAFAGLHARAALTLKMGYMRDDYSDVISSGKTDAERLGSRLFRFEYNEYINDGKAAFLRIAHYFFRCGILWLLVLSAGLPPLILLTRGEQGRDDDRSIVITGSVNGPLIQRRDRLIERDLKKRDSTLITTPLLADTCYSR
jgi:hypothetical protein